MTDHYATLQIPRDAGPDVIMRAWRVAASNYHPDRVTPAMMESPADMEVRREQYTEKFRAAREAFNCLMDREQRARHDAALNGMADPGLLSEDDFGLAQAGGPVVVAGYCHMCGNTGEVRVAAAGFWTRRKCPACGGS